MKALKKFYPLIGLLALCSGNFLIGGGVGEESRPLTQEEIERLKKPLTDEELKNEEIRRIEQNFILAFGEYNLFAGVNWETKELTRPKKNAETFFWYKLVGNLQSYVDDNAGKNKDLIEAFGICENIGNQLASTIDDIYSSVFAISNPSSQEKSDASRYIKELVDKKDVLKKNITMLEKKRFYFSPKKKMVKEVLIRLSQTIEVYIDKLKNNFLEAVKNRIWLKS